MRDYCGMCKNRWWATWKPYGKLEQALRQKIAMNRTWRSTSRDLQGMYSLCRSLSTICIFQAEPRHFWRWIRSDCCDVVTLCDPQFGSMPYHTCFECPGSVHFGRVQCFSLQILAAGETLRTWCFCFVGYIVIVCNCCGFEACFCWLHCNCLQLIKSHGSQVKSNFLLKTPYLWGLEYVTI